MRGLLCEAATVTLTRSSADSSLRTWGLKLRERLGFKRAAVALARKLAVTMHAMLTTGELFDRKFDDLTLEVGEGSKKIIESCRAIRRLYQLSVEINSAS